MSAQGTAQEGQQHESRDLAMELMVRELHAKHLRQPATQTVELATGNEQEQYIPGDPKHPFAGVCVLNPSYYPVAVGFEGAAGASSLVVPPLSGLSWPARFVQLSLSLLEANTEEGVPPGIGGPSGRGSISAKSQLIHVARLWTPPQPSVFPYENRVERFLFTKAPAAGHPIEWQNTLGFPIRIVNLMYVLLTSSQAANRKTGLVISNFRESAEHFNAIATAGFTGTITASKLATVNFSPKTGYFLTESGEAGLPHFIGWCPATVVQPGWWISTDTSTTNLQTNDQYGGFRLTYEQL